MSPARDLGAEPRRQAADPLPDVGRAPLPMERASPSSRESVPPSCGQHARPAGSVDGTTSTEHGDALAGQRPAARPRHASPAASGCPGSPRSRPPVRQRADARGRVHALAAVVPPLAGGLGGVQSDPHLRREPVLPPMVRQAPLDRHRARRPPGRRRGTPRRTRRRRGRSPRPGARRTAPAARRRASERRSPSRPRRRGAPPGSSSCTMSVNMNVRTSRRAARSASPAAPMASRRGRGGPGVRDRAQLARTSPAPPRSSRIAESWSPARSWISPSERPRAAPPRTAPRPPATAVSPSAASRDGGLEVALQHPHAGPARRGDGLERLRAVRRRRSLELARPRRAPLRGPRPRGEPRPAPAGGEPDAAGLLGRRQGGVDGRGRGVAPAPAARRTLAPSPAAGRGPTRGPAGRPPPRPARSPIRRRISPTSYRPAAAMLSDAVAAQLLRRPARLGLRVLPTRRAAA